MDHPKCFVSYSWDSISHRNWVKSLASRLRKDGIDVTLGQWHAVPGDQLPKFMEGAIRENDYVLIVCTPAYKGRADGRLGGVGYEGDIVSAELLVLRDNRKFIPILRDGIWVTAAPGFLLGKYYIDLSGEPYSEAGYRDLLSTLLATREQPPPIGDLPQRDLSGSGPGRNNDDKVWLPLERGFFPVLKDSPNARHSFGATLRDALAEVIGNETRRFAFALRLGTVDAAGIEFPVYELWSHEAEFVSTAEELHRSKLRRHVNSALSFEREIHRQTLREEIQKREEEASKWKFEWGLAFDRSPRAHWVTFEPARRKMQLLVDADQSANPEDYDKHVDTTSEALVFACAVVGQPLAFLGDLGWQENSPRLARLTAYMLDYRNVDLGQFRYEAGHSENWDYRYPRFEAEIQGRS